LTQEHRAASDLRQKTHRAIGPWLFSARRLLLALGALFLAGCDSRHGATPSIEFTRIPQADPGGREKHDIIEGRVSGARPGQQIVIYAKSGQWWVQPLVVQPFTRIQTDSKWSNATHLGTEYAALLVERGYQPPATLNTLPSADGLVAAVTIVKGAAAPPSQTIRFSGYEWRVRDAPSSRGGGNDYDPKNAWIDNHGALHLRIRDDSGKWTCAEVSLTRSLGYGTYSFSVQDTSRMDPAAVFGMFTWDYSGTDQNYREMDIEVSKFGDPIIKNAQYVVQPYYVPANVERFVIPAGPVTHSFTWQEGRVSFRSLRGLNRHAGDGAAAIAEHVFSAGVPTHGIESVRMNLYVFRSAHVPLKSGTEVVIEKFEYLP